MKIPVKILPGLFIILLSSCDRIAHDFGNMARLQDSLLKVYPDENISIKISNGYFINVSFVNSDLKKLERPKKEEIALNVGNITRAFFDKETVTQGWLTFAVYRNFLVFHYSESIDNYELFPPVPEQDTTKVIQETILDTIVEFTEEPEKVEIIEKNVQNDCATVYRVQILATKEPINNKKQKFRNLNYNVEEIIISQSDKYKYKYTIGKECSIEKAKILLEAINKSGYPGAFIVKTPSEL